MTTTDTFNQGLCALVKCHNEKRHRPDENLSWTSPFVIPYARRLAKSELNMSRLPCL